jgi:glycosyltransferase involved in cell wall biosynthesis
MTPLEVIVVDDGSTDATEEVCATFGGQVRSVRLQNGGVSRARNIGAKMAHGEWLVFLDADDVLLPHALVALLGCAEQQGAGVAYGMVIERSEPGKLARLNGFDFAAGNPPMAAQRTLRRGVVATPGSAIVRADLHRRVGGFMSGYEPLEDRDYFAKCGCLERVAFCDMVVLDKTWRPASHGSQHAKRIFRGQRAQRDLRCWLDGCGLDSAWMPRDVQFLKWSLDEAVWWRCPEIIAPLRTLAREAGIWHWRSWIYGILTSRPAPDWVCVEPSVREE